MVAAVLESLICLAFTVVLLVLLARVVLSWLEAFGVRVPVSGPGRTAYRLVFDITEPILSPLRKIVPPAGVVDLSVMVAFVIIFVLQRAIC